MKILQVVALASLCAAGSTALAQEVVKKPASQAETATERRQATEASLQAAARLDQDANNDGIIDSVQSLSVVNQALVDDAKSSFHSTLKKELSDGFRNARALKRPKPRNTCMDYLMLSPEDKDRVNRRVQQRTGGVFGSRPCDPYVSDMIERPFDDEYVELPILPVGATIQGVIVK